MTFGRNIQNALEKVCMFQFSCRFVFFYQLFVFQTGHRK